MNVSDQTLVSTELQDWYQKGRFLPLLGHQLFYIDEGDADAETIVLIHGFPTSSWDWQPLWTELRKRYRLVCLDMLGFGFSAKPEHCHYTMHLQADLIEALVSHLGLKEFHVLAHDYGDTVAQELLARQNAGDGAGRWLSCCFLNGGLFAETHRALLTQKLLLSPVGRFANRLMNKSRFDESFSKVFGPGTKPDQQELDKFWEVVQYNNGKNILYKLITYMNDRIEHRERWVNALTESRFPLALINGSVDPVSGAHMVARYKELHCRLDYLAELPEIGHYPQVEAPNAVLEHYQKFITQRLPARKAHAHDIESG